MAAGLAAVAIVLSTMTAMTLGTVVVGFAASAACAPGRCLSTTWGPCTNVGLQVVLLAVGLAAVGRAQEGRDASGATLAIGLAAVMAAWFVVALLVAAVAP